MLAATHAVHCVSESRPGRRLAKTHVRRWGRRPRTEDEVQDGKEEGGSLPGAGLGTRHQVTVAHDNGNGVLLHGSRLLVGRQLREREREREDGRGERLY